MPGSSAQVFPADAWVVLDRVECLAGGGELPAGGGGPGGLQPLEGSGVAVVDGSQQGRQDRHALAGALIHP